MHDSITKQIRELLDLCETRYDSFWPFVHGTVPSAAICTSIGFGWIMSDLFTSIPNEILRSREQTRTEAAVWKGLATAKPNIYTKD